MPEMTYAESRKRWIATANKLYDRDKASLSKLTNRKEFVNSSLTIDLNLEPLSDDERRELKND